jgi:hypothetical protein
MYSDNIYTDTAIGVLWLGQSKDLATWTEAHRNEKDKKSSFSYYPLEKKLRALARAFSHGTFFETVHAYLEHEAVNEAKQAERALKFAVKIKTAKLQEVAAIDDLEAAKEALMEIL